MGKKQKPLSAAEYSEAMNAEETKIWQKWQRASVKLMQAAFDFATAQIDFQAIKVKKEQEWLRKRRDNGLSSDSTACSAR